MSEVARKQIADLESKRINELVRIEEERKNRINQRKIKKEHLEIYVF